MKNCAIEDDRQCPFSEKLDMIIDNQNKLEGKVDVINNKLFIGNGTPSWDKRIDRLEQTAIATNKAEETHKANRFYMWVTIIGLFVTLLVDKIYTHYETSQKQHSNIEYSDASSKSIPPL